MKFTVSSGDCQPQGNSEMSPVPIWVYLLRPAITLNQVPDKNSMGISQHHGSLYRNIMFCGKNFDFHASWYNLYPGFLVRGLLGSANSLFHPLPLPPTLTRPPPTTCPSLLHTKYRTHQCTTPPPSPPTLFYIDILFPQSQMLIWGSMLSQFQCGK